MEGDGGREGSAVEGGREGSGGKGLREEGRSGGAFLGMALHCISLVW